MYIIYIIYIYTSCINIYAHNIYPVYTAYIIFIK